MGHLELEHEPWMHIIAVHQGEPPITTEYEVLHFFLNK